MTGAESHDRSAAVAAMPPRRQHEYQRDVLGMSDQIRNIGWPIQTGQSHPGPSNSALPITHNSKCGRVTRDIAGDTGSGCWPSRPFDFMAKSAASKVDRTCRNESGSASPRIGIVIAARENEISESDRCRRDAQSTSTGAGSARLANTGQHTRPMTCCIVCWLQLILPGRAQERSGWPSSWHAKSARRALASPVRHPHTRGGNRSE